MIAPTNPHTELEIKNEEPSNDEAYKQVSVTHKPTPLEEQPASARGPDQIPPVNSPTQAASQVRNICCKDVNMSQTQAKKYLLLPQRTPRKTLVLDLDNTILFSQKEYQGQIAPIQFNDGISTAYRNGILKFLQFLHQNFEVIVWSAGDLGYVRQRLMYSGFINYISYVFTRNYCTFFHGNYIKNIESLGRNLDDIILVDDCPWSCYPHVRNCLVVEPFTGQEDCELEKVEGLLREVLERGTAVEGLRALRAAGRIQ